MSEAHLVTNIRRASEVAVPLNRDIFTRSLIRELAGVLEDVVGLKEAAGFVSIVGQNIGNRIDEDYRLALGADVLSKQQVRDVLIDLKQRIQGDFFVIEEDDEKIVFGNRVCPFEDKVIGRPSMCMMTSNVFGSIAAENLGYAKVQLHQTIAEGSSQCRVVVYLRPNPESESVEGREYFKSLA